MALPPLDFDSLKPAALAELVSLRDWLRFAVGAFDRAGLAYGQGATSARDEAAFLILRALDLPPDDINAFADARLTAPERERLWGALRARVVERKPAGYILGEAWLQGVRFTIDSRVIVPRSYLAELIVDGLDDDLMPDAIETVLDLCSGSGCLAILAAMQFEDAEVDAVEIDAGARAVASQNVADHGLNGRVQLFGGDLYAGLPEGRQYDLIIANPPYVDAAGMAALPPEFRAEPPLALAGGPDGLEVIHRIIAGAGQWLAEEGALLCEVGRGGPALVAAYPDLPFVWIDTADSAGEVFWLPAEALQD